MTNEMKALLLETYKGKEVIQYIELLERENKALAIEGEEKCEKLERLDKALDKACERLFLVTHAYNFDSDVKIYFTKDEWKEWCLDE
jgi:plasmid rolling circle replication initiator protein Rep